jgi:threonine dehydrogenase-like Zn-dependent dehydrogenase
MTVDGKKSMKAVVLLGPGRFEVQQIDIPEPGYDEILCAVESVAICGATRSLSRERQQAHGRPTILS